MTAFDALWLPVLLSTVIVFVASAVIHMAPLWHSKDYPAVPGEDRAMEALRPLAIPPGDYMLPRASDQKEMQSTAFIEKMKAGPVAVLAVMPNGPGSMGRNLTLWFVYVLAVGLLIAYVASRVIAPGADYMPVFRLTSVTAFIAYAAALWQMAIWYGRSWGVTVRDTLDALIYGLLTGGAFGWLWPG